MICVKFTAFCDLRADLRIRLATLHKSVRKFWFCKLALTCVDLRVRLARALRSFLCALKAIYCDLFSTEFAALLVCFGTLNLFISLITSQPFKGT